MNYKIKILTIYLALATIITFLVYTPITAKAEDYYETETDLNKYVIARDTLVYSYNTDNTKTFTINVSGTVWSNVTKENGVETYKHNFTYIKASKNQQGTTWFLTAYNSSNTGVVTLIQLSSTNANYIFQNIIQFNTLQDAQTFLSADNGKIGLQYTLLTNRLGLLPTTPPQNENIFPEISVTTYGTYGSFPLDLEPLNTTYDNGQITVTIEGGTVPVGIIIFFGVENEEEEMVWTPIDMATLGTLRRDFQTVSYSNQFTTVSSLALMATETENMVELKDSELYKGYWDTTEYFQQQLVYGLMMTVPSGLEGQTVTLSFRTQDYMAGYEAGQRAMGYDKTVTYNKGYSAGLATAETGGFHDLFSAVFDVPVKAIWGMFDFTVNGIDIRSIVGSIILIAVVAAIMRRFL